MDAAIAELIEKGFDKVTMLGVAKRSGSSKETLYSWFGNREGLFAALIERNGEAAAHRVSAALLVDDDPRDVLTSFGTGLLRLLTGPESVALNRAAMSAPELSKLLLDGGRKRVGPIVEAYLVELNNAGVLKIDDASAAFKTLYGLVVQDAQIRVLLGDPPPKPAHAKRQAALAVDRFFEIYSP